MIDQITVFLENSEGRLAQVCRTAVSYTHLDVYKRQGLSAASHVKEPVFP